MSVTEETSRCEFPSDQTYLSGNDNGFALAAAFINNNLLKDRHVFGGAFDSQISTGDHDSIAQFNNLGEGITLEATWLLNLCHDMRREGILRIEFHNQPFYFDNILRPLNKGKRYPIDTNAKHILQIFSVLGRQARDL